MMKRALLKKVLIVTLLAGILSAGYVLFKPYPPIDYSLQVKPIFNKKCIACHGGVKAKGGFSVLFRDLAMAKTESGKPAILPGDPEHSEMIRRINLKDPEDRMPYHHQPLSKEEIDILTRWVKEGAKWGDHWAYLPVKPTEVPEAGGPSVTRDIDKFIAKKLEEQQLDFSPQAPKETLLRRVSLDLIGMLAPASIAESYLKSNEGTAYETLVDSLLASPRFGERWASMWLDIARYADTKGYEADQGRTIWKYRDWVIQAFNKDMPYDEFIREQIAGDMMTDPTDDQYIATAFHRNSMTNDEGGTDNEEFRIAAVIDRVNTTWEGLMGTTFACVQCHSHPYDPFKHDEYYKFMAYFNNSRDHDIPAEYPLLRDMDEQSKNEVKDIARWVKDNAAADEGKDIELLLRTLQPAYYATFADSLKNAVIDGNNGPLACRPHSLSRLKKVNLEKKSALVWRYYSEFKGGELEVRIDAADGPLIARTAIIPGDDWQNGMVDFPVQSGIHDVYLSYTNAFYHGDEKKYPVRFDWFCFAPQLPGEGKPGYEKEKNLFKRLATANMNGTPVMVENPSAMHRRTFVFDRGNFRTLGAEVNPDVPNSLHFAMPAGAPKNRVGLAMWLTDKRNPLLSRTMVNRLWEQLFGAGLVETLEDMGSQGISPTHKELLDYLSWKLMNNYQWSIKTLLKELVMSDTYRQDSKTSPSLNQKDQFNKWYARGPRVRLSAEQLRDQHLQVSGMLSAKMYGPGVMPWQPEGIWLNPYNSAKWENDTGEDQYRRAIYTYWKRTAPYPSMISFDGAQRAACAARRIRTNTPMQALVILNDSVYIDIARHFARRIRKESGADPEQQIARAYELMLYKKAAPDKLKVFHDLYERARNEFKDDPLKTCQMMGAVYPDNTPESAAMVVVANALLNLDEVIMKN